jgi:hypothetical protein
MSSTTAPVQPLNQVVGEEVVVGGTPGSVTSGQAPTAGQRYRIGAVAGREYVSAQRDVYLYNWLRALSYNVDDITADFGDDLYERMQYDDAVAAAVTTVKAAILSEPVETTAPPLADNDNRVQVANDITDCCRRALRNLAANTRTNGALDDVLWNMCDALALGNKIAEVIYGNGRGADKGRLVPVAIKPKKRRLVSFVVDVYNNLQGFLALVPGMPYPVQTGVIITEPNQLANFLPREKFAVLSWRPKDGDPRGSSMLRPAYTAWNFKMQLWAEYMKFLANFIVPSYIGFLPDVAAATYMVDSNGNEMLGTDGLPIGFDPATDMATKLAQLRNAGVGAFPFGAKVDVVHAASAAGQAFDSAFTFLNDCIARAILGQTLATGEGKHDSRAAAQVHQDVLLLLVKQAKQAVCSMIERDIFAPIVSMNWGDDNLDLVPSASLGEVAEPDKAQMWAAIASLAHANVILPSMWEQVFAEAGMPPAAAEELKALTERWNAALLPPGASETVTDTGTAPGQPAPPASPQPTVRVPATNLMGGNRG